MCLYTVYMDEWGLHINLIAMDPTLKIEMEILFMGDPKIIFVFQEETHVYNPIHPRIYAASIKRSRVKGVYIGDSVHENPHGNFLNIGKPNIIKVICHIFAGNQAI